MSISEARRQIDKALAESWPWNNANNDNERYLGEIQRTITHCASAIVEALAETKPYDGDLNSIRVPVTMLRKISLDLIKVDLEEIGLEDLLISIKSRLGASDLDKDI